LKRVSKLIDERDIRKRVEELAKEIDRAFKEPFVVLGVLKGAFIFTADLVRELKSCKEVDFVQIRSYRGKERGEIKLLLEPKVPLKNENVLIVDDILDSGESLRFLKEYLSLKGVKEVKSCVLLKKGNRGSPVEADFVGFEIPELFVVGYGLDLDERYRNLPYVGYVV